jgi:hypothetical protein
MEPLINISSSLYMNARERDRAAEEKATERFSFQSAPGALSSGKLPY